jgi:hypothetical protein
MSGPAGGVRANDVRQFIPKDGEGSLLIDPVPIGERTALYMKVECMIHFIDRRNVVS